MLVPLNDWTAGAFVASLTKDSFPEAEPLDWGLKVTVREADAPAAMVVGTVRAARATAETGRESSSAR